MDVRCEKCSTEYELDEARLKPGGVTVKCTNCGHTFKVRKREAAPQADVPATMMGMPRGPSPATPAPPPSSSAAAASGERQWLIRLENGETRSCRELATLQQWILAGEVTRDALISRSGKTWKLLGDIVELGTYFTIADEAKQQRARRESAKTALAKKSEEVPRQTLVGVGPVSSGAMALGDLDAIDELGDNDPTTARKLARTSQGGRAPSATDEVAIRSTAPHAAGAEPVAARRSGGPAGPSSGVASGVAATVPSSPMHAAPRSAPAAPSPAPQAPAAVPMPAGWPAAAPGGASGPMAGRPVGHESMPWTGVAPGGDGESSGPVAGGGGGAGAASSAAALGGTGDGPMRGRLNQGSDEPAFAGGGGRSPRTPLASSQPFTGVARDAAAGTPSRPGFGGGFAPDDDVGPAVAPRGSRAGLWIAIASLVVIAGGFAAVYFLVLRTGGKADDPMVVPPADAQLAAGDPALDAGPPPPPLPPDAAPVAAPSLDAGTAELASNVEGRMRAAIAALSEGDTKNQAAALAMRARLATAIAQSLEDRASLLASTDRSAAEKLRQKSKEAVLEAVPLAARALKAAATDGAANLSANLAMADLLRLQGKAPRDLRRYLDVVRAAAPTSPDLAILDGLVLVKEGKLADARALWAKADSGDNKLEQNGDVRLRFRIAVAALADGKTVDARAALDTVMAAQPDHEGAKVLLAHLDRAVDNTDKLPPEEDNPPPDNGGGNAGTGGGASSADSYDKLVKKANDLAEKSCTKAIPVFQLALDKTPTGVAALVGLGFCHIDTKQFSSANSRFRTVLALDSKNERARWGIAEAYQQQGLKAQAIEAYRAYLEVFPSSAAAKRQIELLGGNDTPAGGAEVTPKPEPSKPEPPTTEQPTKPEPTPEQTPAPSDPAQ